METFSRDLLPISERQRVAEAINDLKKDIRENHVEINKHRAAIVWLDNKQHAMEKTLVSYRSLLSPVHKLPSEILSNIFVVDTTSFNHTVVDPLLVSSFSQCLWSSMEIAFDNMHHPNHDKLLQMVQLFLCRSEAFPLDMRLQFSSTTPTGILTEEIPALRAIIDNCRRWRTMYLEVKELTFTLPVFQVIRGCLPILEHLEVISFDEPEDPTGQFPVIDIFGFCPSLTSLDLSFFRTGSGPGLSALSLFPNIERLEFKDDDNHYHVSRETYHGNIVSSKLSSLSAYAEFQHEFATIFDHLMLPYTHTVAISGPACFTNEDITWTGWDERPLHDFLARSGCTITSLTLAYIPIIDQQTISLLQSLPTLKKLSICEYPTRSGWHWYKQILTKSFIQSLSLSYNSKPSPSQLLPRLTHLSLKVCSRNMDQEALAKAILSRWLPDPGYARQIGVDCIQSVSITLEGQLRPVDSPQNLFMFKDVGMDVEIEQAVSPRSMNV
ncbi:hypothetical protein VNI00_008766 [Paramarasmius palmivorus]|uniref:Uncharacterized protein n=1 Tax=Paramarasmius palmivorus TaxID=297713 RepID=A0AAW0CVV4_9AGAR